MPVLTLQRCWTVAATSGVTQCVILLGASIVTTATRTCLCAAESNFTNLIFRETRVTRDRIYYPKVH